MGWREGGGTPVAVTLGKACVLLSPGVPPGFVPPPGAPGARRAPSSGPGCPGEGSRVGEWQAGRQRGRNRLWASQLFLYRSQGAQGGLTAPRSCPGPQLPCSVPQPTPGHRCLSLSPLLLTCRSVGTGEGRLTGTGRLSGVWTMEETCLCCPLTPSSLGVKCPTLSPLASRKS